MENVWAPYVLTWRPPCIDPSLTPASITTAHRVAGRDFEGASICPRLAHAPYVYVYTRVLKCDTLYTPGGDRKMERSSEREKERAALPPPSARSLAITLVGSGVGELGSKQAENMKAAPDRTRYTEKLRGSSAFMLTATRLLKYLWLKSHRISLGCHPEL